MKSTSPLDSLIAFVAIGVLVVLGGLAIMGVARRPAAQAAVATATTPRLAVQPTLTRAALSPTITPTPTITRPPTETPLPTRTPRPTRTPDATRTILAATQVATDNQPLAPERTPVPTGTLAPSPTPRPAPTATDAFVLARPISDDANISPDTYYPYSTTADGQYPVHHGIEFVNPIGTTVLAAAGGEVVFAGSDDKQLIGPPDWSTAKDGAFYGNAIIIRHDVTVRGQTLYTLYGHLSQVDVAVGDRVAGGDPIGEVGMEGVALGPHLHFEVRVGDDSYSSTRNPQLYLMPYAKHGTVAGVVLGADGQPIQNAFLSIERLGATDSKALRTTYSYSVDRTSPTHPDEEWNENFTFGDVPEGSYLVAARVGDKTVVQAVTVHAGRTSWVWLERRP